MSGRRPKFDRTERPVHLETGSDEELSYLGEPLWTVTESDVQQAMRIVGREL